MKSMHVKLIIFLSLLACFCTNKNTYKTPIDFNLITKSNLAYVYDFIGCKNANTIYDRTAFLQIKNNSIDTIFVDTYSYQNVIFLIAPYKRIRLYENHYLLEGSEPFYPPLILDTILPFQNKIYPFSFSTLKNIEDGYFLIEPSLFAKSIKKPLINFPEGLKRIKYPFIVYKVINGNAFDFTDEFTRQFN
jgi:hypothetical protein